MADDFFVKKTRCDNCPLSLAIKNKKKIKLASKRNDYRIITDLEDTSNCDILILTDTIERDEDLSKLQKLLKLCDVKNYVIAPAIACRTSSYELPDPLYSTYAFCDKFDVLKYNPKAIITTGKALFHFTRSSVFASYREFIEIVFNETYFYPHIKSKWKGRIYPVGFLNDIFQMDTFETLHFKKQIQFAQEYIENYEQEKFIFESYEIETVSDLTTFLNDTARERIVAIDTETNSLNVFIDDFKIGCIQVSFDGNKAYYIPFSLIEENKEAFSKWLDRKFQIYSNCLEGKTRILLEDGTEETIAKIVKNKINKKVMCYDNNGNLVSRKINNYFYNGNISEDWLVIRWKGKNNKSNYPKLVCTKEHKIFTQRGEILAKDLLLSDFVRITGGFNKDFMSFLVGSFLGDASFKSTKSNTQNGCYLYFCHAENQKDWLEWKKSYIESNGFSTTELEFIPRRKAHHQDQFGFRMNSTISLRDLKEQISIDYCLENLDIKSLFVWYLDDGTLNRTKTTNIASISIRRFSVNQGTKAVEVINKILGGNYCKLDCNPKKCFDRYYDCNCIIFTAEGSRIFLNLIRNLQKCLRYKNIYDLDYNDLLWDNKQTFHYIPIVEIGHIPPHHKNHISHEKFDLEIDEFHNYIANGIQVHNCKYDMKALNRMNIKGYHGDEDVSLIFHLMNTTRDSNSIKVLSWLIGFGGYEDKLDEYKKKNKISNYLEIPDYILKEYAALDAIVTFRLYKFLHKYLVPRQQDTYDLYRKYIIPVIPCFQKIEENGLLVDKEYIEQYHNQLVERLTKIEQDIYDIVGRKFNIASNDELGKVLEEMGLPDYGRTQKGIYRTGIELLVQWDRAGFEIAKKLVEYRKIAKLDSSFVGSQSNINLTLPDSLFSSDNTQEEDDSGIFQYIMPDGKIHGTIMPALTNSWRSLSLSPNIQNQPKQGDEGKAFRKVYKAPEGYYFAEADYSGFQLRLMGIYSKDESMTNAFNGQDADLHSKTANSIFCPDVPFQEFLKLKKQQPYKDMRQKGKGINLSFCFGKTFFSFQTIIRDEWSEEHKDDYIKENQLTNLLDKNKQNKDIVIAEDIHKKFFVEYKGLPIYFEKMHTFAKQNGYVDCPIFPGLRRHVPEMLQIGKNLSKEKASHYSTLHNVCINTGAQGGEALIIDQAIVKIQKMLDKNKMKSMLVGCVHDSIVLYIHEDEVEEMYYLLKEAMEVFEYSIPILNEIELGSIWGFGTEITEKNLKEFCK